MNVTKIDDFRKHYKKDEVLLKEGEEGSEFFLLEEGSVDVFIQGRKIATLNASEGQEFFGEVAAMLGGPRTATVIATSKCRALLIPKLKVEAIMSSSPSLGLKLVRSLCKKLSGSAHTNAEYQLQSVSLLKSGNTEVSLKNYMKGLLHLLDKTAADNKGEVAKSLCQYFRSTNPWGIQHGDENLILDISASALTQILPPQATPTAEPTPAETEVQPEELAGERTQIMSVQPPRK